MIKIMCKKCKKIIEAYNKNQGEYLLSQHKLAKHDKQTELKRTK
jgi:hypothetical protein